LTVPDADDLLESLTGDQGVAVWKHIRAQDEIFCSGACAKETEVNL
jgi:hypothetical protein